jgi:hypothetical protein
MSEKYKEEKFNERVFVKGPIKVLMQGSDKDTPEEIKNDFVSVSVNDTSILITREKDGSISVVVESSGPKDDPSWFKTILGEESYVIETYIPKDQRNKDLVED